MIKKLLSVVRRAPKRSGALAMLVAAVTVPAALLAWGPSRPTYTMANPAGHVTFNSITDHPRHGDERNFVQMRNYTDNGKFGENVNLEVGKEYEVYVFYHNNASTHLNTAAEGYKGIAENAYMRVQMPATVNAGTDARVTGFVGASNATPASVWDEAYGKNTSSAAVALRYVQNSAKITSNGAVNGQAIDLNKLASSIGTPLGYDKLDGKLPGCTEYSGYVTYRFKVDQPNFEVTKDVSKSGANDYSDKVTVAPGSTVDYKIKYKNTGTINQDNIVIRDVLPTGVTYVPGTTYYSSSKTNNQWTKVDSDDIVKNGIYFGGFGPGGALYVKFTARVAGNNDLATCGVNTLINTASANTPNGSKSDTATVDTSKECAPEKVRACNTETGVIEDVDKGKENTAPHTTDLSKCEKVKACNTQTGKIEMVLPGKANTAPYTTDLSKCDTPAPEKVKACNTETGAIVDVEKGKENTAPYTTDLSKCVKVDACNTQTGKIEKVLPGKANTPPHTTDLSKCDKPAPEKVDACNTETGVIEKVEKGKENTAPYTSDLSKCDTPAPEMVAACNTETGAIEQVEKGKETTAPYTTDLDKCEKVEVCDESNGTIITVPKSDADQYGPTDSDKCVETPVTPETPQKPTTPETPSELPTTGTADALQAIIGIGTLTAAGYYYMASRRS